MDVRREGKYGIRTRGQIVMEPCKGTFYNPSLSPTLNWRFYLYKSKNKQHILFHINTTNCFVTFSYPLTFCLLFKMSGVTTRSSGSKKFSSTAAKPNPKFKVNNVSSTSKTKTVANSSSASSKAPKSSLSQASHNSSATPGSGSTTNSHAGSAAPSNKSQPLSPQEAALLKALLKHTKKSNKSTQEDLHKGMLLLLFFSILTF